MTHNLTNEQLIDQTAAYLRSLPYRSGVTWTDPHGDEQFSCRYRSPDEKAPVCAAGLWIIDEFYCDTLEDNAVDFCGVAHALTESGITPAQINLLDEFQTFHDRTENWGDSGLTFDALYRLADLVTRLKTSHKPR